MTEESDQPNEHAAGAAGSDRQQGVAQSGVDRLAVEEDGRSATPLVDRTIRLFEFLKRAQLLKTSTVHTVDQYERDGEVLWFADFPAHEAVASAHRGDDPEPDDELLTLDRVPRLSPPLPPDDISEWLDGALDDPDAVPELRESVTVVIDDEGNTSRLELTEQPAVQRAYADWRSRWERWAEREAADRPVRDLYGRLFSAYVKVTAHPEELELVVGLGCLAWRPPQHPTIRRHLLTAPVAITFDDDTGQLTIVRESAVDALQVEDDMLDPALIKNPKLINAIRANARDQEDHALHREQTGLLVRRLVQTLDARGEYDVRDEPPRPTDDARASFAPAVILRKRSQKGLIDIFTSIVEQIGETGVVPDGVVPLVDPDRQPRSSHEGSEGALVTVDDDPFLPLPVNEKQLSILRQVDAKAQTLVQGPPGTGKTHTAAVLISHLLAQGKRVLITAHTDQALKEVRDKLPDDIKPLSVAVVGASRADMSDLQTAVQRIGQEAAEYDAYSAQATIAGCLSAIDDLRQQRAGLYRRLIDARGREVVEHEVAGRRGTLASIAQDLEATADRYGWLTEYVAVRADSQPPLHDDEIVEWRNHLLDERLRTDSAEAALRIPGLIGLPTAEQFADLAEAERGALAVVAGYEQLLAHPVFAEIADLRPDDRIAIQGRLHALADEADHLSRRHEAWMNDALADVRRGRAGIWQSRGRQIAGLITAARTPVNEVGPQTTVEVLDGELPSLVALAQALSEFFTGGGVLKTTPDGKPKFGMFTSRTVKQAQALFDGVRVNGLPPTDPAALGAFLNWSAASATLDALDRAWPAEVHIPEEDTLHERLQWHVTEVEQLRRLLNLGDGLQALEEDLARVGVHPPDWNDLDAVREYADLVDAAAASDVAATATRPLDDLAAATTQEARWSNAAPIVSQLVQAVETRDHDRYAAAYRRVARLWAVRAQQQRRDDLGSQLAEVAPRLRAAVVDDPRDPVWDDRLSQFEAAWRWASTNAWILDHDDVDVNVLQAQINHADDRIREQVERLAATRAWAHAASPDRIGGAARADLQQYATLVRKRGKGTGKYTAKRDADIRKAMARCRPAVPVWIMPLYRIADQLRIEPDMFDVVVVDEASQAGLEATFLQYLAPKIVVVGDDKQVSPAGVGRNQQQLRNLARQYLYDDPYQATWQDPQISLFDQARMRFGGLITLTEHRRCVPEIIGFSNRVAYEPEGIRLVPVRQYGAERLEPIKVVFLPDGYDRGSKNKINLVEVRAIADQIEKCLADPAYDGKTLGVISLLGTAQAKAIEKELLDRIEPEVWTARQLRCGDAAHFQGSERDVMFLSMVAAPTTGKRLGALTRDLYVQRYNVAASRAKDQMWVFHSVAPADLGNPDDMRFALLDYCYGVVNDTSGGVAGSVDDHVPEDVQVAPFDSLFEQRVFNCLLDRGYTVVPQYPAEGYRLDLVVVGAKGRLAVECDGDAWHGPDAYQRDLARQRDLERCGWQLFRVRESAFYVDRSAALQPLWERLDALDIRPSGWVAEELVEPAAPNGPALAETDPAETDPGEGSAVSRTEPGPAPPAPTLRDASPSATSTRGRPRRGPDAYRDREDATPTVDRPAPDEHRNTTGPESTSQQAVADAPPRREPSGDRRPPNVADNRAGDASPGVVRQDRSIDGRQSSPPPGVGGHLAPYTEFTGVVPDPQSADLVDIVNGLARVVGAEGPVIGQRLHTAYVRAYGGQRVGGKIAKRLNSAIYSAVRRGILIEDAPLGETGIKPRTYRLPDQSADVGRLLGPRTFDEIPPQELAAIIISVAFRIRPADEESLFRGVLDELGLKRLTNNVVERFRAVAPLVRDMMD